MLSLDDGRQELDRGLLDQPGGFAWWYLDHVGEDGTSVVLIPSFGLPFLPGYASAARRGEAPTPRSLPSLNVVVSHADRPTFYLLQRYPMDEARWTDDGMVLGRSHFRSALVDGTRRFTATLDCPIPGTADRLRGTVRLEAPAITLPGEAEQHSPHRWSPLGVGEATVDLSVGNEILASGPGRAYHDRNGCSRALHDLGIGHWVWGRAPFEHGELIHYLLWPDDGSEPRAIALFVARDGQAHPLDVQIRTSGKRLGWCGMPWDRRITLVQGAHTVAEIHHRAVVDDGPFYLRFHTEVTYAGRVAHGVGEAVRPERVDRAAFAPFVRMAVDDRTGANSMWLPLFAGPRSSRLQRLLWPRPAGRLEEVP